MMLRTTAPRALMTVAVLLGLLSTGLGKTMRLENLHSRPMSASSLPDQSALMRTDRMALVIGNSNYPDADADAPLPQLASDAGALANAFRNDSFLVDVVENGRRADIIGAIDRLKARVRPNSIVLVYFAGYGVQSGGQNYMIPVDAKIWDERDVRWDGVSIDRLLSELKNSGARMRLAVIDASRRNPYERRFRSYSHGLAPIQTSENTLVLTSAAPDQVVDDPDGVHTPLTTALLKEMNSSARSIQEIFEGTRAAVAAATQNRQVPTVSSTVVENVSIGPAPHSPISSAERGSRGRRG